MQSEVTKSKSLATARSAKQSFLTTSPPFMASIFLPSRELCSVGARSAFETSRVLRQQSFSNVPNICDAAATDSDRSPTNGRVLLSACKSLVARPSSLPAIPRYTSIRSTPTFFGSLQFSRSLTKMSGESSFSRRATSRTIRTNQSESTSRASPSIRIYAMRGIRTTTPPPNKALNRTWNSAVQITAVPFWHQPSKIRRRSAALFHAG